MANVNMWVMVLKIGDSNEAEWQGMKSITEPDSVPADGIHYWVQLSDTDDIWIKETWDFETGPLPKRLRGSRPSCFKYNLTTKQWIYTPLPGMTWDHVRMARDAMLSSCDWIVVKHQELGTSIPQEWLEHRNALRDFPVTHAHLSPEEANHVLAFIFDPVTKARRISLGLSLEPTPFIE